MDLVRNIMMNCSAICKMTFSPFHARAQFACWTFPHHLLVLLVDIHKTVLTRLAYPAWKPWKVLL